MERFRNSQAPAHAFRNEGKSVTDSLRLYDTLSSSIRAFAPTGSEVRLYVCGVTPYDTAHLGHAFTYVAFDVLVRYLTFLGYRVDYVQNVTDVDDPLFVKARQLGMPYDELAAQETERFLRDMAALNVLPAGNYPRASRELPAMIHMAEALVESGHAYLRDGRVYFGVANDATYGELSKWNRATMIEVARDRGGDPDDPRKDDPLDFLLWRPSQDDEPAFDSPWGPGLPGWHLECSAMSLKYLGVPLDIHGGGEDLIFPHHENEIAQSETAAGIRPLARHWMHTAMVYMDGEKMSKSLGNMVFARDLIDQFGSDAVRVYLSSVHYRSHLHWNLEDMEASAATAKTLLEAASLASGSGRPMDGVDEFCTRFTACLNDDLDTPRALGCLIDFASRLRSASAAGEHIEEGRQALLQCGGILGLTLGSEPAARS
jgi:L-cysteine:1D-myo-inositol 2-amino-2-deoxy-alpha-D-glucopyranoside ligase